MKQQELLFSLISICIVIFAWITFTVIHNSTSSTISDSSVQAVAPIVANFDTKTIGKMKARLIVTPEFSITVQQTEKVISQSPEPPTPLSVSTPSITPIASQGGSLQQ